MALLKRLLTVDFGADSIKLAEFQLDGEGGVTLARYGIRSLEPTQEPSRPERFQLWVNALRQLMEATGIRPGRVIFNVSEAFTRTVQLPRPEEGSALERMIEFEARQNIPFPLEDVVWDYRLSGEELFLIALRREDVNEGYAVLTHLGMTVLGADASPLALARLFHRSQPDDDAAEKGEDGCALVMDMGAAATHLVFIGEEKLFCRSAPTAGSALTRSIFEEFGGTFAEAEALKRDKATLQKTRSQDQQVIQIAALTRQTFSRLHFEAERALNLFKERGCEPKGVFLTGGSSLISHTSRFLKKRLGLPVQNLDPFRGIALSPQLDLARVRQDAPYLAVSAGMALLNPEEIRLLPPAVQARRQTSARRPYLAGALVLWALAFLIPLGTHVLLNREVSRELARDRALLEEKNLLLHKIRSQEKLFQERLAAMERFRQLAQRRAFWPAVLNELNQRAPETVWLTGFEVSAAKQDNAEKEGKDLLVIEGLVEAGRDALQTVVNFRRRLEESPFFDAVHSERAELLLPEEAEGQTQTRVVLKFRFHAVLTDGLQGVLADE